jgi:hypothetical protein
VERENEFLHSYLKINCQQIQTISIYKPDEVRILSTHSSLILFLSYNRSLREQRKPKNAQPTPQQSLSGLI